MKLKWIFFGVFLIASILCLVVLFLMYTKLSFIDYPYLYSGLIFLVLSILSLRLLKK